MAPPAAPRRFLVAAPDAAGGRRGPNYVRTTAALMARVKELDAVIKEKDKQIQQANADHEATASRLATLTSTAATPYRTLASRLHPVFPSL